MGRNKNKFIQILMNFDENHYKLMKQLRKNQGVIHKKLLISQLIIAQELQS